MNGKLDQCLIFDRTHLHCSSSVIKGKKLEYNFYKRKINEMAIYDCFQYFDEDHIVDLRLNILINTLIIL